MRIGTAQSTKILDLACVNEYKIPLIVMMENAVNAAFKHMDIENNFKYVIVSGVGNNGGDGLGIARHLLSQNKEVKVFIVGNTKNMSECFEINYKIIKSMGITIEFVNKDNIKNLEDSVRSSHIVVDCILEQVLQEM